LYFWSVANEHQNAAAKTGHAVWRLIADPHRGLFTATAASSTILRKGVVKNAVEPAWLAASVKSGAGARGWAAKLDQILFSSMRATRSRRTPAVLLLRRDRRQSFSAAWEQGNGVSSRLARDIDALLAS